MNTPAKIYQRLQKKDPFQSELINGYKSTLVKIFRVNFVKCFHHTTGKHKKIDHFFLYKLKNVDHHNVLLIWALIKF